MKYFLDTKFLEGTQRRWFGINTKPTIDLISIGIVAEDGREYYAISKDFNLKEAWNRWQQRTGEGDRNYIEPKLYWIRDNVLKPIWEELVDKEYKIDSLAELENPFTYKGLKYLINKYGKTNKQIAEEIKEFIYEKSFKDDKGNPIIHDNNWLNGKPQFYGYYADYDWVVFCWLFGKMIDLPNGFPKYCIDLKQEFDKCNNNFKKIEEVDAIPEELYEMKDYKYHPYYPKQTKEHHALDDAKWNKRLYEFLNNI